METSTLMRLVRLLTYFHTARALVIWSSHDRSCLFDTDAGVDPAVYDAVLQNKADGGMRALTD